MTLAIVDDYVMFLELLRTVLTSQLHHKVVGEATNAESAIHVICDTAPDVVLLDLELPGTFSGFDVAEILSSKHVSSKIIAMTAHSEPYTVYRMEHAHFHGFVSKTEHLTYVLKMALAAIRNGNTYFSPAFQEARSARHRDPLAFDKILSPREQEVLSLIGSLLDDDEISIRLGITIRTVEKYRHDLLQKLGMKSANELKRYAKKQGFTIFEPSVKAH